VQSLVENPFAVLTAVVAPAILTNACSVLSLGTGNRIARVVDRTRIIVHELASLTYGSTDYQWRLQQLERLRTRSGLLLKALRLFFAALGCFAASALLSVVGASLVYYEMHHVFRVFAIIALTTGMVAVTALVVGCAMMIRETSIAVGSVGEEVGHALEKFGARPS